MLESQVSGDFPQPCGPPRLGAVLGRKGTPKPMALVGMRGTFYGSFHGIAGHSAKTSESLASGRCALKTEFCGKPSRGRMPRGSTLHGYVLSWDPPPQKKVGFLFGKSPKGVLGIRKIRTRTLT